MNRHDIVIVGGGIAGASLGAVLADRASVLMLEMEPSAGYHATGRAVSFWEENYGGIAVKPQIGKTTCRGRAGQYVESSVDYACVKKLQYLTNESVDVT